MIPFSEVFDTLCFAVVFNSNRADCLVLSHTGTVLKFSSSSAAGSRNSSSSSCSMCS